MFVSNKQPDQEVSLLCSRLSHHVLVGFQRDLEDVSLLCLGEEEEHALSLVSGAAHEQHAALRVVQVVPAPRNRAPDVRLVSKVLVGEVVLRADQNATGTFRTTGHYEHEVCLPGICTEQL